MLVYTFYTCTKKALCLHLQIHPSKSYPSFLIPWNRTRLAHAQWFNFASKVVRFCYLLHLYMPPLHNYTVTFQKTEAVGFCVLYHTQQHISHSKFSINTQWQTFRDWFVRGRVQSHGTVHGSPSRLLASIIAPHLLCDLDQITYAGLCSPTCNNSINLVWLSQGFIQVTQV